MATDRFDNAVNGTFDEYNRPENVERQRKKKLARHEESLNKLKKKFKKKMNHKSHCVFAAAG